MDARGAAHLLEQIPAVSEMCPGFCPCVGNTLWKPDGWLSSAPQHLVRRSSCGVVAQLLIQRQSNKIHQLLVLPLFNNHAAVQDLMRIAAHLVHARQVCLIMQNLGSNFGVLPQDFARIAAHLDRRTPGDCVQFYYRTQKLDEFAALRRKLQLRKRRMQVQHPIERVLQISRMSDQTVPQCLCNMLCICCFSQLQPLLLVSCMMASAWRSWNRSRVLLMQLLLLAVVGHQVAFTVDVSRVSC